MTIPILYIGNKNYSSWSLRGWLAVKKAGIAFKEEMIYLFTPESNALLKQASPSGKVPALREGHFVVWDSLAICEYMAELNPSLLPTDSKARAVARSICAEMHSGLIALRSSFSMNCKANRRVVDITPEIQVDIDRIDHIWTHSRAMHKDKGKWLMGDFSIVDIMFAPVVIRFTAYNIPLSSVMQEYVNTWLSDADMQAWIHDGKRETAVLDKFEIGQIVNKED